MLYLTRYTKTLRLVEKLKSKYHICRLLSLMINNIQAWKNVLAMQQLRLHYKTHYQNEIHT